MNQDLDLGLRGIHHVELYVGNAKQAEYYYRHAFGFSRIAYAGPETGLRDRASYVLEQGKIRLVLTAPLHPEGEVAEHIKKHGDGVKDIAFLVDDVREVHREVVSRGGTVVIEPREEKTGGGGIWRSAVRTYGDTVHGLIQRNGYRGAFLPGYEPDPVPGRGVGLLMVDHIVGNVEQGKMDAWVDFYSRTFGFHQFKSFDDKDISTEYTALQSKVMASRNGLIKFPINEPAPGLKKSQIEEYLDFYIGPGAQHVALRTGDIIATVGAMLENGVEFLEVPGSYYDSLLDRVGEIDEDVARIRKLGILVDRDEDGYLLQLFTKPVADRPTLFYEVIQRKGSQSFGKGNFRALFEAIEREQARRGNL